jgi:hypothetical protein
MALSLAALDLSNREVLRPPNQAMLRIVCIPPTRGGGELWSVRLGFRVSLFRYRFAYRAAIAARHCAVAHSLRSH